MDIISRKWVNFCSFVTCAGPCTLVAKKMNTQSLGKNCRNIWRICYTYVSLAMHEWVQSSTTREIFFVVFCRRTMWISLCGPTCIATSEPVPCTRASASVELLFMWWLEWGAEIWQQGQCRESVVKYLVREISSPSPLALAASPSSSPTGCQIHAAANFSRTKNKLPYFEAAIFLSYRPIIMAGQNIAWKNHL